MKPFGFPRSARLLHRSQFDRVYRNGRAIRHPWIVVFCAPSDHGPTSSTRIGFTVSRRVSKHAVVRNRIRRVWREAARQLRPQLRPGFDLVLNARVVSDHALSSRRALEILTELARREQLLRDEP